MVSNFTFPRNRFIGFDSLFNELERHSVHRLPEYPKHNVVKHSDEAFSIQLALAGFGKDDVKIELKENLLTISGAVEDKDIDYIHKGISTKKFNKSFRLHEHVQVVGAAFQDGLLEIGLQYQVPEDKKVREIEIGSAVPLYNPELLTEDKSV